MNKSSYFSNKSLITPGEFAKLSQSTKRTVQWYIEKGLLKPVKTNSKGYRFFTAEQIIDFQVILLLRKLNFSLLEIKNILRQNTSAKDFFKLKQQLLIDDIKRMQRNLKEIKTFYHNMDSEGLLIKPTIKTTKKFEMYYLEKEGSYAKIYDYLVELKSCFKKIPKNATYLTLFPETQYLPQKDRFKVGVVVTKNMQLKPEALDLVNKEIIEPFKSLSYRHHGSPALISMLISQSHEYRIKHDIKLNDKLAIHELEFYYKSGLNGITEQSDEISEINIPIL